MTKTVDLAPFATLFARMEKGGENVSRFAAAIETFNAALTEKKIFNVVYSDLKSYTISRFYDKARDYLNKDLPDWDAVAAAHSDFYFKMDRCYSIMHVAGRVKMIDKYLSKNTYAPLKTMRDFYALFVPVAELIEALKPFVVKGRQPNPNAKPEFVPGRAGKEAILKINAILTEQIAGVIEQYRQYCHDYYMAEIKTVKAMAGTNKKTTVKFVAGVMKFMTVKLDDAPETSDEAHARRMRGIERQKIVVSTKMLPNWEQRVADEAQRDANRVRDHFVMKNTRKLAKIVDLKGKFKDAVSGKLSVQGGVVNAEMNISFTDGSKFMVRNKLVYGCNSYGTHYTQYPTTFHDVVLSDGKTMKGPNSEEQMNKVFAVTK